MFLLVSSALCTLVMAQYNIPHGVVGNGGGVVRDGNVLYCTAGQLAVGSSSGGTFICNHGFWYPAAISSTVEVAITSFRGECIDNTVVLYWHADSDALFDGFNVYRERGNSGVYERINDEMILPAEECTYSDGNVEPGETYCYRIGALQQNDEYFSIDLVISIPPKSLTLYQNFPNPFSAGTSIKCFLPAANVVTIEIFNVSGQRIKTLVDREKRKGFFVAEWDGRDTKGNFVSSGVYLCKITVQQKTLARKMILLR